MYEVCDKNDVIRVSSVEKISKSQSKQGGGLAQNVIQCHTVFRLKL